VAEAALQLTEHGPVLGHTKTDTTDIYLLDEVQEAMKIAKLLSRS